MVRMCTSYDENLAKIAAKKFAKKIVKNRQFDSYRWNKKMLIWLAQKRLYLIPFAKNGFDSKYFLQSQ